EAPRLAVTIDTAPSGTIHVYNNGGSQPSNERLPQVRELHRIRLSGTDTLSLDRISDIAMDSRRNLYLLQARVPRVLQFDSTGVFLRSIGRGGEGPGEFRFPDAIEIDSLDNLWVWDVGTRRVSIFDVTGQLASSHSPPLHPKRFGCHCVGFTPDGTLVEGY